MQRLKTLFAALADALNLLADEGEARRDALVQAHRDTEDPGTDAAVIEAAARFTALTTGVTTLYLSTAECIENDHGGSVDPVGMGAPITAASLRLEATFVAHMPKAWLKDLAGAYGDVADIITEAS